MGVFKEETHVIDEIARQQKQIYADACDFGVYLKPIERAALRTAIQEIRHYCHTRPVERTEGSTGDGTRTDFFVAWDQEGDTVRGSHYTVETWTPKGKQTLFTITCQNKLMTKNSFDGTKVLDRDFIFSGGMY